MESLSSTDVLGVALFLFGVFCAYWAQTTRRNPWLWFILGALFGPLTGLALLYRNSHDQESPS